MEKAGEHLKAIIESEQPYLSGSKRALYFGDDASPLVEFWRAEDYRKAAIDTDDEEGRERQAKQGRAKRFVVSKESWLLIAPLSKAKVLMVAPSFDFRLWAGELNAFEALGSAHLDAYRAFFVASYLCGPTDDGNAAGEALGKLGRQISERLAKDSQRAQASLYPIEMILNHMACSSKEGLIEGETFCAFLTRSLNNLAKRKEEAANKAAIADIDALISDLDEIKNSKDLVNLWEGIFRQCEERRPKTAEAGAFASSSSGAVAVSMCDLLLFFGEPQTPDERERVENYKHTTEKVAGEIDPLKTELDRLNSERLAKAERLEQLEREKDIVTEQRAFVDTRTIEKEIRALKAEIEANDRQRDGIGEQITALEEERANSSKNLLFVNGKYLVNHPLCYNKVPYTSELITNKEGLSCSYYKAAGETIEIAQLPNNVAMLYDTREIRKETYNRVILAINNKCRDMQGATTLFFPWEEVYDLIGGCVDPRGKSDAKALFMKVLNLLNGYRITRTPDKKGAMPEVFYLFPKITPGDATEGKEGGYARRGDSGVTLFLDSAFAKEMAGDPLYTTKGSESKRLPLGEGTAWDRLRRAEHLKQAQKKKPEWKDIELAMILKIEIYPKHMGRTRKNIEKLLDAYDKKGMLEVDPCKGVQYDNEGKRLPSWYKVNKSTYWLRTGEGAKDLAEAAKEKKAKALQSKLGGSLTEARQALNRCDGDMKLAERRIIAGELARGDRSKKRAAKAKEKKEKEAK